LGVFLQILMIAHQISKKEMLRGQGRGWRLTGIAARSGDLLEVTERSSTLMLFHEGIGEEEFAGIIPLLRRQDGSLVE